MIAIDSSVLLDMLTEDPQFAAASAQAIEQALAAGGVVVCDAVVAEVQTLLATSDSAMDVLNEYLARMTDIVVQHGGTINEFIGDAVFAVFGAPLAHTDHAERAASTRPGDDKAAELATITADYRAVVEHPTC